MKVPQVGFVFTLSARTPRNKVPFFPAAHHLSFSRLPASSSSCCLFLFLSLLFCFFFCSSSCSPSSSLLYHYEHHYCRYHYSYSVPSTSVQKQTLGQNALPLKEINKPVTNLIWTRMRKATAWYSHQLTVCGVCGRQLRGNGAQFVFQVLCRKLGKSSTQR